MNHAALAAHYRLSQSLRHRTIVHQARLRAVLGAPSRQYVKKAAGRRRRISQEQIDAASRLEKLGYSRKKIAAELNVNRCALWRHLGAKQRWNRSRIA